MKYIIYKLCEFFTGHHVAPHPQNEYLKPYCFLCKFCGKELYK